MKFRKKSVVIEAIQWFKHAALIKPEPKPDVISYVYANEGRWMTFSEEHHKDHNLKLTFDGDTLALKTAEVIK